MNFIRITVVLVVIFEARHYVEAQNDTFRAHFDSDNTKTVLLNSEVVLTCYIFGNRDELYKLTQNIQIAKMKPDGWDILSAGKNSNDWEHYNVIDFKFPNYPPPKLRLEFKILSVRIVDDTMFSCRIINQTGYVFEDIITLQVAKMPELFICSRDLSDMRFVKVSCSAKVYPRGKCDVFDTFLGNTMSTNIVYNHQQDELTKIFTTNCSMQISKKYKFKVTFSPSIDIANNLTIHSDVITAEPSTTSISYFKANDKTYSINVGYEDDLKFECSTGQMRTRLYLMKKLVVDNSLQVLVVDQSSDNKLEFEIDDVTCADSGQYYCQAGYDTWLAKSVTVKVSSCASDTEAGNNMPSMVGIYVAIPLVVLCLIIIVILVIVCCIRHQRRAKPVGVANGRVLQAEPSAPYPGANPGYMMETSFQMSPPPYSIVCNKDSVYDALPPPYPGVMTSGCLDDKCPPQVADMESPPPYS